MDRVGRRLVPPLPGRVGLRRAAAGDGVSDPIDTEGAAGGTSRMYVRTVCKTECLSLSCGADRCGGISLPGQSAAEGSMRGIRYRQASSGLSDGSSSDDSAGSVSRTAMSSGVWKTAAAVSDMLADSSVSMAASSTRIQKRIVRVCLQESSKGTIYGTNIVKFLQIQELRSEPSVLPVQTMSGRCWILRSAPPASGMRMA